MEVLGLLDIPLWIVLTAVICLLVYIYATYPDTVWKNLGVPSPPSAPFFGHMHQLYNPKTGMRGCFEKWRQEYGKVYGILFFRHPCLVVSDIDVLKEVMVKDFNNYADRHIASYDYLWQPILKKGVFFNTGQDWKRIRRIMTPSFSSGKLKMLTHYINATAQQLVDRLQKHAEAGTDADAKTVFSAFSLDVLAGTAFGLELNSQDNVNGSFYQHAKGMVTFKDSLRFVVGTVGMFPFLGWIFRLLKISFINHTDAHYFEEQLTKLILERKNYPDQFKDVDFLQFLMNAEADESDDLVGDKKLTIQEIVAQGIVFVIAGYETTSSTLQWLSLEITRNPEVQKKLKEEIADVMGDDIDVSSEHCLKLKYMEAVINESLRMYPPVITLTRLAQKSSTLGGMPIPAGAGIHIPVYNIGRDPELFEDPNTFNPDRFLDEKYKSFNSIAFLPFGFGPRQCIGLRLAMLQMKIALVHMLKAVNLKDASPKSVEVEDFSGLLVPKIPIKLTIGKTE